MLYSQNVIELCQRVISPFLYLTLEYFYCPCIEIFELKCIREDLITEITNMLIKGKLAQKIIELSRFQFFSQEIELAQKCSKMHDKDLKQIGVDESFTLQRNTDPFRESIYMLTFLTDDKTPMEKMKMMVMVSKKIVEEIEIYY
jgi:hypothetical protein